MERRIALISPDPETSRLLTLRLEIDSVEVAAYTSCSEFFAGNDGGTGLVLLDVVNTEPESVAEVDLLAAKTLKKETFKTAVILPRGSAGLALKKAGWEPDIEFKRPFEIGFVSGAIRAALEKETPVRKPVRTGAPVKKTGKSKRPNSPRKSSSSRKTSRRRS